jgi:hypothetical protein
MVATDTASAENETDRKRQQRPTTSIPHNDQQQRPTTTTNTFHSPQLTNPLFKQEGQKSSVLELMVLE